MTDITCRLAAYVFKAPSGFSPAPGTVWYVYAADEPVAIEHNGNTDIAKAGEGQFVSANACVKGNGWLFEFANADCATPPDNLVTLELSAPISLDPREKHILRADAVSSPSGAQTPRHRHAGPGIRWLTQGVLLAELNGVKSRIEQGKAWFESGVEWVVGTNINSGENTFIRIMVLPASLSGGQTSFIASSAEEAAKPRAVLYHPFSETGLPDQLSARN